MASEAASETSKGRPKLKSRAQSANGVQGSPTPGNNTKTAEANVPGVQPDVEDVEELPFTSYPRFKDDLPNAFNGAIDASKDQISGMPVEILDHILSYLSLDHDAERGVKVKEGNYKPYSPALLSMAAMSHLFYRATEGFSRHFLHKNQEVLGVGHLFGNTSDWQTPRIEPRRSARIAARPKSGPKYVFRQELLSKLQTSCGFCLRRDFSTTPSMRASFANTVLCCEQCESDVNGPCVTLTDALKTYDLRDYMLLKSRKPGPRANVTDLPTIPYASEYRFVGFPVLKAMTVFTFRLRDVRRIAEIIHGDAEEHMWQKNFEKATRRYKARCKRIKEVKLRFRESELKQATGECAQRHERAIKKLLEQDSDHEDDDVDCDSPFAYFTLEELCGRCGDVLGAVSDNDCYDCFEAWSDRRWDPFYDRR